MEGKRQLVVYFTLVILCNRDTYGIKALPLSLQQVILKTYVLRMYTNHVCTMTRLLEDTEDEVNFHVLIFQHLMPMYSSLLYRNDGFYFPNDGSWLN